LPGLASNFDTLSFSIPSSYRCEPLVSCQVFVFKVFSLQLSAVNHFWELKQVILIFPRIQVTLSFYFTS
jgi:hypothetical protein